MESQYVLAKIELPILINSDGTYKIENEYTNITFASLSELPPKQSKKQIELSELLTQLGGNTQLTTKITLDKLNYDDEESKGLIFRTNINNDDNDDCNTSIVMSSLEFTIKFDLKFAKNVGKPRSLGNLETKRV